MPLTDYAGLKDSVAGWLNRGDLTAVIPDFIALFEAEASRTLRVRDNCARVMTQISTQYVELPSDYREAKFLKLIVGEDDFALGFLDQRSISQKRRSLRGSSGQPLYYSLIGNTIEFCPTPDAAYLFEMGYYSTVPALSGTNITNWLLTKHPDLYLYGSLLQSAPYLRDDDRIPVWQDAYTGALSSITSEDEAATYSGGTIRVNARRIG